MSFDLRHLRYVIAAGEHRSFFQAALALEIEQSTMSRNIVRLERRLGVKLFQRSHAGVSPTSAGAEFIRAAHQILARSDQLLRAMQSADQGKSGRLTIGYSHAVPVSGLHEMLTAWRLRFPAVEAELIESSRELLIAGLDAHVVHIAILPGNRSFVGTHHAFLWSEKLMQRQISFSGYWRQDNDDTYLHSFLDYVRERCS